MSHPRFRIRAVWLWAGAVVIPLLAALEAFLYYPALLRSGRLPAHADSIAIPIYETVLGTPILMLVLLAYALPAIHGYRGNAGWTTLARRSPWRTVLSILLYAVPAVVVTAAALRALVEAPLYESLSLLVAIPLVAWLLMLRAAMAAPRGEAEARGA